MKPFKASDIDRAKAYVSEIEAKEGRIAEHKDDIKALYEAAKAAGIPKKALRRIIKIRKEDREGKRDKRETEQSEFEWLSEMLGISNELPLHRHFEAASRLADGSVVDLMKSVVPEAGEITVQEAGVSWRVWRDVNGEAHAERIAKQSAASNSKSADSERPRSRELGAGIIVDFDDHSPRGGGRQ